MNYNEENKKIWEEHFYKYSLDIPNEEVVRFMARCRNLYPGGKMLDWGCATGRHTVLGCKWGFSMVAADYVAQCVEITKDRVERECSDIVHNVDYIVNQSVNIEQIKDETLDVILAFGCVFSNPKEKQQEMIDNMYRMLKKGGRAFCDFRTQRDSIFLNRGNSKQALNGMLNLPNGVNISILSLEELQTMFLDAGFTIESIELNEFTQDNQKIQNSWWHFTVVK